LASHGAAVEGGRSFYADASVPLLIRPMEQFQLQLEASGGDFYAHKLAAPMTIWAHIEGFEDKAVS
jgi:hypothetical protein